MMSEPSCPRCGYDQSGAVAAWEHSEPACCPLAGVCSECGLAFHWRDAFAAGAGGPGWLYERRRGVAPGAAWVTALRALHPPGFWARVQGTQPVRVWRLIAWLAVVLGTVYLARAGLYLLVAWWTYQKHPAMVSNWQYLPWYGYAFTWPVFGFVVGWGWWPVHWSVAGWPLWVWTTLGMSAGWAAGLVGAGLVSRRVRGAVGAARVARAWVYSHAWLGVLGGIVVADLVVSVALLALGFGAGGSARTGFYYSRSFLAYGLLKAQPGVVLLVLAAWQAWWWNRAIVRGWRVERAWELWWSLLGLSILAAIGAAFLGARVLHGR